VKEPASPMQLSPESHVTGPASDYWQNGNWLEHQTTILWREYADWINRRLLASWLDTGDKTHKSRILKTDLYEEAVGTGQAQWLGTVFDDVTGVDISPDVVREAKAKNTGLTALVADTRKLPYEDASFDAIVSLSTLDHFPDRDSLLVSIAELSRILNVGGTLVITLDNPANPIVWLRQVLPAGLVRFTGLVPYYCGETLRPKELVTALEAAGLEVEEVTFIMHCIRVLAVPTARMLDKRHQGAVAKVFARCLRFFECFARLPTRSITGNFTAVRCRKPARKD